MLMLGFGAFNILVARPRLSMRVARRLAALGGVARTFGRSVRAELVVGVVVLGVAAVLTGLARGRADLARQAGTQPGSVDRRLDALPLAPRVRISPATVGQNHFAVDLADAGSATVERVQLTLTFLDNDLGSEPLILQPSTGTPETWEADSSPLSQPGPWQADLLVRRQGQDDVRSTILFPLPALPTGSAWQAEDAGIALPVPTFVWDQPTPAAASFAGAH